MQKKSLKKQPMSKLRKLVYIFLAFFFVGELVIMGASYYLIDKYKGDIPSMSSIEHAHEEQSLATVVYSSDGVELDSFQRERRYWVSFNEFPQVLVDAVLATEDKRFFSHWGLSPIDIVRAMVANFKAIEFGFTPRPPFLLRITRIQGGSTITQQLAKLLYYGSEKKLGRKIPEMITTIFIERTYSKEEILEMYLNKYEFSNNRYGIQAATRWLFEKDVNELNLAESALMAGMLNNSSLYNPKSQLEWKRKAAWKRRNNVLRMMVRTGKIPRWKAEEEMVKDIELASVKRSGFGKAPYFVEYVRKNLVKEFKDRGWDDLETSGSKITTTLDYRLQRYAEEALSKRLEIIQKDHDKRLRYVRPPELSNTEAELDSLKKTQVQGALVAIDIKTGAILAMIGGSGYSEMNWFNRATQARRSAGSSFKPFVYTAALDNGWRCSDTIIDAYWNVDLPNGTIWEPKNFEEEWTGTLSLRDGFKQSRNMISVKLVNDLNNRGIGPDLVKRYAQVMGVTTPIPAVPSIAIGTPEVRLLDMVSAYTAFPSLGIKKNYFSVKRIEDRNGTSIQNQQTGKPSEVLNPEVASLMITMMRSVVEEGTGRNMVPAYGMGDRVCAGKTGTSNDNKDAWFIGYTPYICCGVWIGFDSEETRLINPHHTGASAAIPVWATFMKDAHDLLDYPKDKDFTLSSNITTARICRESYKRATQHCPPFNVYTEYYMKGTEVNEFCDQHGSRRNGTPDPDFRDNRQQRTRRRRFSVGERDMMLRYHSLHVWVQRRWML